jgi:hypothetical protein
MARDYTGIAGRERFTPARDADTPGLHDDLSMTTPHQTLANGTRVTIVDRNENAYHPGPHVHNRVGLILRYATPDLQANQVWTAESYYVRVEGDPAGAVRVLDRANLIYA